MRRPGRRRQTIAVVVVLALLGPVASAPVAGVADAGGESATVDAGPAQVSTVGLTQRFAALPDRPGIVRATHRFEIPDSVDRLETAVPPDATVVETQGGFSHDGGEAYVWTDGSDTASITYRLPVNETGTASGPVGGDGEFRFVDVGEWGLFRRPAAPIDVTYYGSGIDFDRRTAIDGAGVAGDWLVFVGEAAVHRHTASSQRFRLAVPEAARLAEAPADIFDSVGDAAGTLQVGARDETVLMIAAPTTVDWGVEGLQVGESDFYVTDDERLDDAHNTWLHEYVHTRQSFDLTRSARWVTEATATYYAALLSLQQEHVSYDEFRDALEMGTRSGYADTVLADPATWTAGANYFKGSLVVGDLDRRIRLGTGSSRSFQAVHRRLNERSEDVDADEFEAIVTDVSSAAVGDAAERYTTTDATPATWDRSAHQEAFGELPARISYDLPDGENTVYRIDGPYRNITTGASPFVLVPGERLGVELTVRNVGGTIGSFEVGYGLVDGEKRTASGTLEAGQSVVEQLWIPAGAVGDATVRVGEFERSMVVVEPATLEITELAVNRTTAAPGDVVGVSVSLLNPEPFPGNRTLTVMVNGDPVTSRTVYLRGSETRTVSIPVPVSTLGENRIAVGDRTRTVTVAPPGPETASDTPRGTTGGSGPGPGPLGVALGLGLGGWLVSRRI
jgi:hypothetical protein